MGDRRPFRERVGDIRGKLRVPGATRGRDRPRCRGGQRRQLREPGRRTGWRSRGRDRPGGRAAHLSGRTLPPRRGRRGRPGRPRPRKGFRVRNANGARPRGPRRFLRARRGFGRLREEQGKDPRYQQRGPHPDDQHPELEAVARGRRFLDGGKEAVGQQESTETKERQRSFRVDPLVLPVVLAAVLGGRTPRGRPPDGPPRIGRRGPVARCLPAPEARRRRLGPLTVGRVPLRHGDHRLPRCGRSARTVSTGHRPGESSRGKAPRQPPSVVRRPGRVHWPTQHGAAPDPPRLRWPP